MKKLLVLFLTLAWLVSPAFGDIFTEMIGDDDNFYREPEEDNATNGAQFTDLYDTTYQRTFIFDFGTPITDIIHATLEVKVYDLEDDDSAFGYPPDHIDIQINVDGYDVLGAFDDMCFSGTSAVVIFDLLDSLGADAIEDICSDGVITIQFLNAGTYQELWNIDYVSLTIETESEPTTSSTSTITTSSTSTTINIETFSQTIGDDDNFGWTPDSPSGAGWDKRSSEEESAVNGAQYTDWDGVIYQKRFIFDFGMPITNIGQVNIEMNAYDIEDAGDDNVDIQLNIEGYNVPGAFDDVDLRFTSDVISFDLLNLLGLDALEVVCSDGIVTVDFLNAGSYQELYSIDWVSLSIGESPGDTTTTIESTTTTTADTTTTTTVESTTTTTTTDITVDFMGSPTFGFAPLTVNFTNLSTGGISGYEWNFGDGSTSGAENPSHTYTSMGNFGASLTAYGTDGSSKTEIKPNYVFVIPGCPFMSSLENQEDINTLKTLRDSMLNNIFGLIVTCIYYQNSTEVASILAENPELQDKLRKLVGENIGIAINLINGEKASVTGNNVDELIEFLNDLKEEGSLKLKADIDLVIEAIRGGYFLYGLGMNVE